MATETADNGNVEGTTGSVPGLAYVVAVGGDPKAKTRKYIGRKGRVTSRYLRPKIASCHDRCKSGMRDETPELKKPGRRLGVRKIWVKKKPVRRSVEPVKRNKVTKTKPKTIPRPKICVRDEPTHRKSTQNVKQKPSPKIYAEQVATKGTHTGSSPRKYKPKSPRKGEESMTKAKLKQLLAEKITEITLHEGEVEELEFVPPTVDIIEASPEDEFSVTKTKPKRLIAKMIAEMTLQKAENAELETVATVESPPTVTTESTNLPSSESYRYSSDKQVSEEHENSKSSPDKQVSEEDANSKSSSDKQVSKEERENANNEEVTVSEVDDKVVNCEDKENDRSKVKFMRGKVVEVESEDDDPRRLNFRRGKILDDNDDDGPTRLNFRRGKILEGIENDGPTRLNFRRGKILDGNEDDSPTRLNFRRGKVLEDDEDDSPTRLNFRKGTILEDNDDDQSIAKMNFQKTIIEEATDDGKKESETVTLKHQEMQEKKEAQELLNRVIEETASKLEVDRKNKVEALVGAFESVISLRDNTPSSQ